MKYLRIACAFTAAAIIGILTWNKPIMRFRDFWRLMRASWNAERVTPVWYSNRMDACSKCPIFFSPLRTCGSPLSLKLRGLGCWCSMEVKAWFSAATCWLRTHESNKTGYGWPDGL